MYILRFSTVPHLSSTHRVYIISLSTVPHLSSICRVYIIILSSVSYLSSTCRVYIIRLPKVSYLSSICRVLFYENTFNTSIIFHLRVHIVRSSIAHIPHYCILVLIRFWINNVSETYKPPPPIWCKIQVYLLCRSKTCPKQIGKGLKYIKWTTYWAQKSGLT